MKESHAVLVAMMQSVDEVTDFVRRNPASLRDNRLEDRLREVIQQFHERASREDFGAEDRATLAFAVARSRTDEKLKRQLLRAVFDGVLVKPDEGPPAYNRWFNDDVDEYRGDGGDRGRA